MMPRLGSMITSATPAARKPERLARILFASNVLFAGADIIRTHHPDMIEALLNAETIEAE